MFGVIKIERIGGGFFKRLHYRLFPPGPRLGRIKGFNSHAFSARTRYRADKRFRQCSVFYADACV